MRVVTSTCCYIIAVWLTLLENTDICIALESTQSDTFNNLTFQTICYTDHIYRDANFSHFDSGTATGRMQVISPDPDGSDDGALTIETTQRKIQVLQVFPDGHDKKVFAQGIANVTNMFEIWVYPIILYNSLSDVNAIISVELALNQVQTKTCRVRDFDSIVSGVADCYGEIDLTSQSAT